MDIEELRKNIKQHIENKTIILDEATFSNTYFHDCVFVYRGKTPPRLKDNIFSDCIYRFENEAQNTIEFLQQMHSAGGNMKSFVLHMVASNGARQD